jgi:hypothetical protein
VGQKERPKPYTTNRKEQKEKVKRSESAKEFNLRSRKNTTQPMEVEDPFVHYQPPPVQPTSSKSKKPKMKSQPSVVDQLTPYDVLEDILKLQSTATVGQMLQYPNQRKNLVKILK